MAAWWTDAASGQMRAVGDRVGATFPPGIGFWTFEAARMDARHTLRLTCVEAYHVHEGQPPELEQEWLGTHLNWTFTPTPGGSDLTLTHVGLADHLLCCDICTAGWRHFFEGSLRKYL